ncbi:carboxypeptidase-like regulatory domain-containing protein [Mucilaginibacter endophyticus]|uniref:carboxypeptidase-like regulatory domain-containing protein n=1 Tax=Mucilaginibacter endophyticus TaxID=2675003 RepID=UPI000E0DD59F|nr:carboxypeptidase-like regulatory domain-containing protein [Mucilaginibacter endophyticus]
MGPIQHISIPKPCHEQWQQMTTVSNGRYCGHCCKTVIDFTVMSNEDVINYLAKSGNVCGRLNMGQLNSINNKLLNTPKQNWKTWLTAVSLLLLTPITKIEAKTQNKTEQGPRLLKDNISHQDTARLYIIKGIVKDVYSLIPGATISIKGEYERVISDTEGRFKLAAVSLNDTLRVSYIGYVPQEFKIADIINKPNFVIIMAEDLTNTRWQTVVAGGICVRASLPKRIWRKIKSIF